MMPCQPEPEKNVIHPELLSEIPLEWRDAMTEFLSTGRTLAPGFDDFIDQSEAAQAAIDAAFEAHLRGAAQNHLERIERTGGSFQAAEAISQQTGLTLSDGIKIGSLLEGVGNRLREEQKELDENA